MILVVDSTQVTSSLEIFADEKDRLLPSGKRIFITPITLLMALCVPLFISETLDFQLTGVVTIAVGDSFSAVIGSRGLFLKIMHIVLFFGNPISDISGLKISFPV